MTDKCNWDGMTYLPGQLVLLPHIALPASKKQAKKWIKNIKIDNER